jgi:hypothetical protein
MDSLKDLLPRRLNQRSLGESARAAEILHSANRFFREAFPDSERNIRALKLDRGILHVAVSGSAWGHAVWELHHKLLAHLQSSFGEKAVCKVLTKSLTIE